jgi:hypothetical protein
MRDICRIADSEYFYKTQMRDIYNYGHSQISKK